MQIFSFYNFKINIKIIKKIFLQLQSFLELTSVDRLAAILDPYPLHLSLVSLLCSQRQMLKYYQTYQVHPEIQNLTEARTFEWIITSKTKFGKPSTNSKRGFCDRNRFNAL